MPKIQFRNKDLELLFFDLKEKTSDFANIEPEVIQQDPKKLLIIRLALGMSQNEFERIVSKGNKNISKYETGKIKRMNYETAKRMLDGLNSKIPQFDLDRILSNFQISKDESNGWFKVHTKTEKALKARRKGVIRSLRSRLTRQESRVAKDLKRVKLDFESNFPVTESTIVDFYIETKDLVIECKEVKSKSRREFKEQVQKLAYQGYKTKFKKPKMKLWALIESKHEISEIELGELKGPFDEVFTNSKDLIKMLS
ncbi:hypothetical protein A3K63_03920 [Candidatus Micrarchaeota archaeon RBG_16_49_10]|nr:MAG: hypothetical protein A3K63_03920 [Candidatus Micrarchaeota archaeon RBG_16_49_10]